MNKSIVRFSIQGFIIAVILYILGLAAFKNWFPDKYFSGFSGVIILVFGVTVFFHSILIKAAAKQNMAFINKFLAFTGFKLLMYLFFIIGYIFLIGTPPVSFLLTFLLSYLVFTVFEVVSILEFLKKNYSKSGSTNQ